jgi:hypothetical protein
MRTIDTQPSEEIINQIGIDPKITREFNYSHGVLDSNHVFKHYCAIVYPHRYIVDEQTKLKAAKEYERMKADKIKEVESNANTLYFVGMGMDYAKRYDDDVCNHRIRTEIINPKGRRFFIEVGTWGEELMRIDFVIDRDLQKLYEDKRDYYYRKIQEKGGFLKHGEGSYLYDEFKKYESQPYYWYKEDEWSSLRTKYTNQNILKLVNSLFDCNFNKIEIDYHFLTTEDYISKSI